MTDRLNILLAESDAARGETLAAALREAGWQVSVAHDASAALTLARRLPPAAAVIDADLAGSGALIVLKRLRAAVHTAAAPVLVTGHLTQARQEEFRAAGATDCPGALDAAALPAALRAALAPAAVVTEAPAAVLRHPLRMAALRASGLLDSPPEAAFDRVTQLAAHLLAAPTALLSLVDQDRQFFKSQVGLSDPWASARQSPLSHSFCQWVVSGREPVSIGDAREHQLLRHNQAIRDMGVVAYTGVPVNTVQGETLGSLCAIDARPRAWSARDLATLTDLARLAESCIAHAMLVREPPQSAEDFDHYVEATGNAITGALGILRRDEAVLDAADRTRLYDMIEECSRHLVQLNRLIQVNQHIR